MTNGRPYDHRVPREYIDPETRRRECFACGLPTTGAGSTLRHVGEAVRPIVPEREHVEAFITAVQVARQAQDRLLDPDITPEDIARVIVEELYAAGALRSQVGRWKPQRQVRTAA